MPGIEGFSFRVGIESVMTPSSEIARQNLPGSTQVVPNEDPQGQALNEMLSMPTLADSLRKFIQPRLTSRELLLPEVFVPTLESCAEELHAEGWKNNSEKLENASKLLSEIKDDRDMLNTYRNLLVSG